MGVLLDIDKGIFLFINHIQNGFLDFLTFTVSWITELAALWLFICFLIIVFDKKDKKRKAILILLSLILIFLIINVFFKTFIFRQRPYLAMEGIKTIGRVQSNSSFPSGHVASSAAAITILIYLYKIKKLWKLLLLAGFIFLIGFSRIYAGMHYPSDILAGLLVGLLSGAITIFIDKKIKLS